MAASPPFMAATFFLLVLLLLRVLAPAIADVDEAAALLAFGRASAADDPRGALVSWTMDAASGAGGNSTALCSWAGVSCAPPPNGRVVAVNLSGMGLAGELRLNALLTLSALQCLDLRGNAFYSNLSHASSSSCALVEVDISSNAFNGMLPPVFLASCGALRFLNLSRNSLVGGGFPYAPSHLSANLFTGRLPELASCNEVTTLDVLWNHMSGALPAGLVATALANLTYLSIAGNNS